MHQSPLPESSWSRPSGYRSGRAFTLIELVIVVGIIGLLVALLLPAVQSARETARRAQCVSSLRQIGVAMNAYHTIHQMFPSSQLFTGRNWTSNGMSELSFLLPHLEQQALYASINMAFANIETPDFPTSANQTPRRTSVGLFLCPSDRSDMARNSYRFNRGRFGMIPWDSPYDGPFSLGAFPSQATVTDGLSTTAFVSERVAGSFSPSGSHRPRDVKHPPTPWTGVMRSDAQFIPYCLASEPDAWLNVSGRYWLYSGFVFTHYNHNGVPNDRRPTCGFGFLRDFGMGLHPPRSFHPGGVNVLFGDGHVAFEPDSVNASVWTALGTYNAGDLLSEGS
ncbi:MAG: DUF1559 domain-containing protein [Isosphaeraceae bacterium]